MTTPRVTVPVEPTEAMMKAADAVDWNNEDERASVINMWQAMLSAAQADGPDGEYDRADIRYGLHRIANEDCDEVAAAYYAKKTLAYLAPLSAAPAPEGGAAPFDRDDLIALIMEETTDDIVADGWDRLGKPNVLVQGCRYIRRNAPPSPEGYANPEASAKQFAGFIADRILKALATREDAQPVAGDWQSIAMWMGFAASVIKSGEPWTGQCQREFDEAKAAYARLSISHPAPDALRVDLELLEEVCARYADDEDAFLSDNGEPFGSITTECGMKARDARKRFRDRQAALQAEQGAK